MPIFFQDQLTPGTRLGIWKIEETEEFFKMNVPQHRHVTHPVKRLQHLAGRFLLQYLFPDFPFSLIQIADTKRPFLPNDEFHFSISHCGDYAAAIVSRDQRVGIDIEIIRPLVGTLVPKFLSMHEQSYLRQDHFDEDATLLWSAKEAVFKWYGEGEVDFRKHIELTKPDQASQTVKCHFNKTGEQLMLHYRHFSHLVLAWVRL